jgi:hypothetical protein
MSHGDTAETPIENDQRHSVADLVMQFGALIALRVSPALGGDQGCPQCRSKQDSTEYMRQNYFKRTLRCISLRKLSRNVACKVVEPLASALGEHRHTLR